MNIFETFRFEIQRVIQSLFDEGVFVDLPDTSRISVELPRERGHGDISTNAAMLLAKAANIGLRELAAQLAVRLGSLTSVDSAEVAGPGFINLKISACYWHDQLRIILTAGIDYGESGIGFGEKVNIEYISANPTGPLHVAHARGAVTGDALAKLLEKAGFDVTTEYYINDAGAQVDALARSAHLRYREALGEVIETFTEGLYPGEYMVPVGQRLAETEGEKWLNAPERDWLELFRSVAVDMMMNNIREDLIHLGIRQEIFRSEQAIIDSGEVDKVFKILQDQGLIYVGVLDPPKGKKSDDWEPRSQTLFRSTAFGDDVDRPLKKSDGSWTYFANDVAYHYDKYQRGFKQMINVFGADHGGYVKRMKAAVSAITGLDDPLDICLCQIVHLKKSGEPVRMSKRAGTFVTLRGLIDEIGTDAVRFYMLTRKSDTQMDFDLEKVVEQTRDNPVFYVQYAHARCKSVLRNALEVVNAEDISRKKLAKAPIGLLNNPAELDIIRHLAAWPQTVETSAQAREPHRIAYYLNDLAELFHGLWNKGRDDASLRFIQRNDQDGTLARIALVRGVSTVIASGLDIFGVKPVEELR